MSKALDRFYANIEHIPFHSCWEWTKPLSDGYGRVWIKSKYVKAHRLSYELFVGTIPQGASILHSCHNRACVNPKHLRIGTHQENMQDRKMVGKYNRQYNGRTKLSQNDLRTVTLLRSQGQSYKKIGSLLNVSPSCIAWNVRHNNC